MSVLYLTHNLNPQGVGQVKPRVRSLFLSLYDINNNVLFPFLCTTCLIVFLKGNLVVLTLRFVRNSKYFPQKIGKLRKPIPLNSVICVRNM